MRAILSDFPDYANKRVMISWYLMKHPVFIAGLIALVSSWVILQFQELSFFMSIIGGILLLGGALTLTLYASFSTTREAKSSLTKAGFKDMPKWQQILLPVLVIASLGLVSWLNLPTLVGYIIFGIIVSVFVFLSENYKNK